MPESEPVWFDHENSTLLQTIAFSMTLGSLDDAKRVGDLKDQLRHHPIARTSLKERKYGKTRRYFDTTALLERPGLGPGHGIMTHAQIRPGKERLQRIVGCCTA